MSARCRRPRIILYHRRVRRRIRARALRQSWIRSAIANPSLRPHLVLIIGGGIGGTSIPSLVQNRRPNRRQRRLLHRRLRQRPRLNRLLRQRQPRNRRLPQLLRPRQLRNRQLHQRVRRPQHQPRLRNQQVRRLRLLIQVQLPSLLNQQSQASLWYFTKALQVPLLMQFQMFFKL